MIQRKDRYQKKERENEKKREKKKGSVALTTEGSPIVLRNSKTPFFLM